MKNSTNLFGVIALLLLTISATAQTNVSGGIYNNTTWTKANSPYIVVDTVVVFPGVTLTIEPGVTVKFEDGKYMEIRQSNLIALGTVADSITFTSNSTSPYAGIWQGIHSFTATSLQLNYDVFEYANTAIQGYVNFLLQNMRFYGNVTCLYYGAAALKHVSFYSNWDCLGSTGSPNIDSCIFINNQTGAFNFSSGTIANSVFINNQIGLYLYNGGFQPRTVKNCIFCNNEIGCVNYISHPGDIIENCNFSQNHIGLKGVLFHRINGNLFTDNDTALQVGFNNSADSMFNNSIFHNQVGVLLAGNPATVFNNNVCNNTIYNIQYEGAVNTVFQNTCWCDTDSAAIAAKIYDGYDNVALGLVNFIPFINCDSSAITSIPPINCQTVIITQVDEPRNHLITEAFTIYPNPASDNIILNISKNISQAKFKIYNILGELKYSSTIEKQLTTIDISSFATGVYVIEVIADNKSFKEKFVKSNP